MNKQSLLYGIPDKIFLEPGEHLIIETYINT